MKISEIRDMKTAELKHEVERVRQHVFELRSQAVTEKLENQHQIKLARRDIARMMTVLHDRGIRDVG